MNQNKNKENLFKEILLGKNKRVFHSSSPRTRIFVRHSSPSKNNRLLLWKIKFRLQFKVDKVSERHLEIRLIALKKIMMESRRCIKRWMEIWRNVLSVGGNLMRELMRNISRSVRTSSSRRGRSSILRLTDWSTQSKPNYRRRTIRLRLFRASNSLRANQKPLKMNPSRVQELKCRNGRCSLSSSDRQWDPRKTLRMTTVVWTPEELLHGHQSRHSRIHHTNNVPVVKENSVKKQLTDTFHFVHRRRKQQQWRQEREPSYQFKMQLKANFLGSLLLKLDSVVPLDNSSSSWQVLSVEDSRKASIDRVILFINKI